MTPTCRSIPGALKAIIGADEKTRFEKDYFEANFVLGIIKEAVEKKIQILLTKEESEENFKEPGYMEKYIHMLGQRKMAKEILNLFPKI